LSVEAALSRARERCSGLRRVSTGDKANPEDYNQLVDCAEALLEGALALGLAGGTPEWAPILDIGRLDYMIVGEPRRLVTLYKLPEVLDWRVVEYKPVYGYLSETDVRALAKEVNMASGYETLKEELPLLRFGSRLTSDYWNRLTELVWRLAEDSGLPFRPVVKGGDLSAVAARRAMPSARRPGASAVLASTSSSTSAPLLSSLAARKAVTASRASASRAAARLESSIRVEGA